MPVDQIICLCVCIFAMLLGVGLFWLGYNHKTPHYTIQHNIRLGGAWLIACGFGFSLLTLTVFW